MGPRDDRLKNRDFFFFMGVEELQSLEAGHLPKRNIFHAGEMNTGNARVMIAGESEVDGRFIKSEERVNS